MLDQGGYNTTNTYGFKPEDAKDFDDQMEFEKLYEFRKRSGRVYFRSTTTGRQYTMYLDDFANIIKEKRFNNNRIEGTFHFIKRSSGQAIQLVPEKP
jgi:hypothetical protein